MIIVEGMDNTGKSTLVEQILDKYPKLLRGFRIEFENGRMAKHYAEKVLDFFAQSYEETFPFVFDRILFSESVYGPILRNGTEWSAETERQLYSRLMRVHVPLIIYCKRTPEQIKSSFSEREQLDGVGNHIDELCAAYDMLMEPFADYEWFVEYDYENDISRKATEKLIAEYLG